MMGAATFPPKLEINTTDSYEYKHKPKRLGEKSGIFVSASYPCGEFSYSDDVLKYAYSADNIDKNGNSIINNYSKNTFFCPAMSNLEDLDNKLALPFDFFSESNFKSSPSIAPIFAMEYEKTGGVCAYAHIAKGAVSIEHYLQGEASEYFNTKVSDFFSEARTYFSNEDTSCKVLVWCQGESNADDTCEKYLTSLNYLWKKARSLGFTHFFCVRIGNWIHNGEGKICNVMKAQEKFCHETESCYMMTRAMSCMPNKNADGDNWFAYNTGTLYEGCRDNENGFSNDHINEKGFMMIAKKLAENTHRVLDLGMEPLLEKEPVKALSEIPFIQ